MAAFSDVTWLRKFSRCVVSVTDQKLNKEKQEISKRIARWNHEIKAQFELAEVVELGNQCQLRLILDSSTHGITGVTFATPAQYHLIDRMTGDVLTPRIRSFLRDTSGESGQQLIKLVIDQWALSRHTLQNSSAFDVHTLLTLNALQQHRTVVAADGVGITIISLEVAEDRGIKYLADQLERDSEKISRAIQEWFPHRQIVTQLVLAGSRPFTEPARSWLTGYPRAIILVDPAKFHGIWSEEIVYFWCRGRHKVASGVEEAQTA
ncbi:hypothetical protein BDZ88DRAFT_438081 [Geranomyces variabilis]|nr:hypothetical protein BDZ88DRAFT_438081 [Geranomyces variabilis]